MYEQGIRRMFGMAPADFEASHRKDLEARKLNLLIASAVHVPDSEVDWETDKLLSDEKDPKERAKLASDPEKVRERLREKQINLVFADWLTRVNADLKVTPVSEAFRQRLAGTAK